MCHHDSEKVAHWMRERETEEDEAPDDEFEDLEVDADEEREPATSPADD
jgi:hypothetical protein